MDNCEKYCTIIKLVITNNYKNTFAENAFLFVFFLVPNF